VRHRHHQRATGKIVTVISPSTYKIPANDEVIVVQWTNPAIRPCGRCSTLEAQVSGSFSDILFRSWL
jgi:hypothetical protein